MGPFFDYYDYDLYIYNKAEFTKIPSTVVETLKQLFLGLFYIFLFSTLSQIIKIGDTLNYSFYYEPLWYKLLFSVVAMKVVSLNYFGGFKLAQAMIASSGITYAGECPKTKKPLWNRVQYLQIWDYESSMDMRTKTETWNISIQQFLRRYIFERLYSEEIEKRNPQKAARAS